MTQTIEDLIPDYLRGLPVYVPGKPIEEVERELKIHAVKLASNENPLGPSPKAMVAARAVLGDSNRYPDGGTHALRQTLAERRGVSPEEIFIGLGSSELIDLAARALLRAGLQGLTSEGTYAPFSVAIRASGAELVLVPQRAFAFDLKAMARAITPKTGVMYLANPNNPTGSAYAIGRPDLLSVMNRLMTPFNTSGVAQAAALAALDDNEHVTRCIETNARERKRLSEDLAKMGFRPVPSEANFIFIVVGSEAQALSDDLLQMGVIVRPLGWMGFPEAIRISVGTSEENDKCLSAMARVILKRAGEGELAAR